MFHFDLPYVVKSCPTVWIRRVLEPNSH